jgi:hypothetical protein
MVNLTQIITDCAKEIKNSFTKESLIALIAISTVGATYIGAEIYDGYSKDKHWAEMQKIEQDAKNYWKDINPNGARPSEEQIKQMQEEIEDINQEIYRKANPDMFPETKEQSEMPKPAQPKQHKTKEENRQSYGPNREMLYATSKNEVKQYI